MAKAPTKEQTMPTLADIRAQMEALKQQEAELLAKEREPIIAQMKENITAYNITAAELGFTLKKGKKSSKPTPEGEEKEAVIKYRDGANTWTGGRGRKPKWVTEKIAAGEDIEKYKVA